MGPHPHPMGPHRLQVRQDVRNRLPPRRGRHAGIKPATCSRRRRNQPFLFELHSLAYAECVACTRAANAKLVVPLELSNAILVTSCLGQHAFSVYTCNRRRRAAGSQPPARGSVAYGGCAHITRLVILNTIPASVTLRSHPSYSNPFTAPFTAMEKVPL